MKFARRGEGIKSARNVFKRAREDPRSKFQVNLVLIFGNVSSVLMKRPQSVVASLCEVSDEKADIYPQKWWATL